MGNDVIAIQETMVNPDDASKPTPQLTGMKTYYLRNDKGVGFGVKTALLPQRITELEDDTADAIWISVAIKTTTILLGNIYANKNNSSNNLEAALHNITKALQYAKKNIK